MGPRMWVWVGIGMIVSTMLISGMAFAVGQQGSWQVPQAMVVGSGNLLPQSNGGAPALPSIKASEVGTSLQLFTVQGVDRSSIGQGQLLAQDGGGGSPPRCGKPPLPPCD